MIETLALCPKCRGVVGGLPVQRGHRLFYLCRTCAHIWATAEVWTQEHETATGEVRIWEPIEPPVGVPWVEDDGRFSDA